MNAGFLRRSFSSLADILIVVLIVYLTFLLFGRLILRNQVDHFDEMYPPYQEMLDVYNDDLTAIGEEYTAQMTLAGDNDELKAEAQLAHQKKLQILEMQNTTDIEPFNRELSRYFLSIVYYFALGFLILVTIYALAFKGRTLGRKIMQVRLEGPVHSLSVFFHDVVFKYFFIIVVFVVSPYGGIALLFLSLIIDLVLISFTRKKATLRDILLKINVVKTGYGY
ncbi:MAG: RDD family protein [Candidatus Izemoplasmatales bacterium]|jgi:hypothetical protein|nr:RDD family protein [Candidatus Izemoplasmatales bacterium]